MSVLQLAIVRQTEIPNRDSWQAAIDRAGFALVLDADFDPLKSSGYTFVRLDGVDAAFEYDLARIEDVEFDVDVPQLDGREHVLALATRGDMRACAAATCAAAALVDSVGGIFFDGEKFVDAIEAMRQARANLKEI